MAYDLDALGSAGSIKELFAYSNTVTNDLFMTLFLVCIFFVFFIALKRYSFTDALLSSSFMTFVLSLFLLMADLISIMYPILFGTVMAFTAFYAFVVKSGP